MLLGGSAMFDFSKTKEKLTSFQIIILGFVAVILIGAFLLMLPIATKSGESTPFIKALFTSTSAVCVTGLVIEDTASYWSDFGQTVIIVLIQIGGLGVVSVASFITIMSGRKINIKQRQTMQSALSAPQMGGIIKLTRFIFITAFLLEVVGVIMMLPVFVPKYGKRGIWLSIFHSISAFCNSGFDLMGDKTGKFSSMTSFSQNLYMTVVISFLIVTGGIGFITWRDVVSKKNHIKEYTMQTKVIIVTTATLIIIPTLFFFVNDFSDAPFIKRLCTSLFQSITPRTAGFNNADLNKMTGSGKAMTMILMLIGGSPGSTAGGMKTTTIAVLFANAIAVFRKKQNANFFGRRMDDSVIRNAATILFMYTSVVILASISISIIEKMPISACMYEAFSAIGTVGLSLGITPHLSAPSLYILMGLMFFGRVGGLTLIYAAFSHQDTSMSKYPMENITVG